MKDRTNAEVEEMETARDLERDKATPAKGFLYVGHNEQYEIVVNHPDLEPDENGVGHIVFSVSQARGFAYTILRHADECENELRKILGRGF
jgi:hypothetical protein